MHRDIAESRRELDEEQRHTRRTFGRERDQLSTLAHLGLSEVEAVEYVLMLIRDEEAGRGRRAMEPSPYDEDEGVFMGDFDDLPTPMATPSTVSGLVPSDAASRRSSSSGHSSPTSGASTSVFQGGRTVPRVMPSTSNHKVQVSPRFHPEPMEAGVDDTSLARSASSGGEGIVPPMSDSDHFPAVSRTPSSASGSGGAATSIWATPASSMRDFAVGSPQSMRSAWSNPLHSFHSSEASSPSRVSALPSLSPTCSLTGALAGPGLSGRSDGTMPRADEDDEDLRFAIELSLAEARSREEDV